MTSQFTFTAELERPTSRDGSSADFEFDVDVTYRYTPGVPAITYLHDGDPDCLAYPAEVAILAVRPRDPHMGADLVAEDALSAAELAYLEELASADAERQP